MRWVTLWRFVLGGPLSLSAIGCQVLLDVDAQCAEASDCERRFGGGHTCSVEGVCLAPGGTAGSANAALPERWECLREPARDIEPDRSRSLQLQLGLYDYLTGDSVPDATARACNGGDVRCARPIGRARSNAEGRVAFDVPYGFDGHLEFDAAGAMPLLMSSEPLTENTDTQVPIITLDMVTALASSGGEPYDPERGFVVLDVVDCNGMAAEGVHVEVVDVPDNRAFYFGDSLPTRDLNGTVITTLGRPPQRVALAAFNNVAPGYVPFRISLEATGQRVTYITLQVRAQTMTLTRFRPGYL